MSRGGRVLHRPGIHAGVGCIQALQCNKNTCPVGITTHDKSLQRGFVVEDKARRVANYVRALQHDWRQVVSATGVHCISELTPEHLYIPSGHPIHAVRQQEIA